MKMKYFISSVIFILCTAAVFSESFFSGYTGGKLTYSAEQEADEYNPELRLQAFFQGQFNYSENLWSHIEFSINTDDFISEELFHSTGSDFSIDEISLISKAQIEDSTNYLSLFMGTYDPIGSDIFLRRYFATEPIASKITESWLGMAGSILYPHFGLGLSDVLRLHKTPAAVGFYTYLNHEDQKYFVLNADLRFALVYRYLSFDIAGGIGAPLSDRYENEDVWLAVDKVYWHAGTTLLLGNNYTQSLFIQAGLFNAPFTRSSKTINATANDIYLLVEPRFIIGPTHINISVYSFPEDTVKKLSTVVDTLGANINFFADSLAIGRKIFSFGTHVSYSLPGKTFLDLKQPMELLKSEFNVTMTPYIYTNFLSGQLHFQGTVNFVELTKGPWYKSITADIGFRTNF